MEESEDRRDQMFSEDREGRRPNLITSGDPGGEAGRDASKKSVIKGDGSCDVEEPGWVLCDKASNEGCEREGRSKILGVGGHETKGSCASIAWNSRSISSE